jgi:putative peptidoglycan binding protein/transglycosylase-like protein with SLT domain
MRRGSCILALVAATSLATAAAAEAASPRVAALQLALFQRGYYRGPFNGVAGLQTRRATKRFQRRHHLAPDGVAGPRTRAKLGRWARYQLGQRLLRRGRRGWDVAELQFLLRRNGVFVSIDGVFGRVTEAAVIGVQRASRLRADGIAGAGTVGVLGRVRGRLSRLAAQAHVRGQINRWSRHYGVDAGLACALAWVESGHQPSAKSRTASGVFQVGPARWRFVEHVLADRRYPHSVEGQVRVGILYFRHLLRTFGDARKALAAWYAGPGRVRKHGIGRQGRWFAETVLAIRRRC